MRALLLLLLASTMPALAGDEDASALLLADKTTATAEQSQDWRVYVETAARESRRQEHQASRCTAGERRSTPDSTKPSPRLAAPYSPIAWT